MQHTLAWAEDLEGCLFSNRTVNLRQEHANCIPPDVIIFNELKLICTTRIGYYTTHPLTQRMVPSPFNLLTDLGCHFVLTPLDMGPSLDKQLDDIIVPLIRIKR